MIPTEPAHGVDNLIHLLAVHGFVESMEISPNPVIVHAVDLIIDFIKQSQDGIVVNEVRRLSASMIVCFSKYGFIGTHPQNMGV